MRRGFIAAMQHKLLIATPFNSGRIVLIAIAVTMDGRRSPRKSKNHNNKRSAISAHWKNICRVVPCIAVLLTLLASTAASAQTFCVYDPMGAAGDYMTMFKDYQLEAKRWKINIDLVTYTDDDKMIQAFEGGHCAMASMIGFRAVKYNMFTGTIDTPSTIENYVEMRDLLHLIASPRLAQYMTSDPYEVVGVLPLGAGYVIVNDRKINTVSAATGKKVVIPKFDKGLSLVVTGINAKPVPEDLLNYGKAFADVDILMIPLVLYKPLEVERTVIKTNGGIVRRPLFELTVQIVSYHDKFPAAFGQQSREYIGRQADRTLGLAHNLENSIDNRFWIYVKRGDLDIWNTTMRNISNEMVKQGYIDKRMLGLLRRIRCKSTPDEPECRTINEQKPTTTSQPTTSP